MMITVIAKRIFLTISAKQLRGLNRTFWILHIIHLTTYEIVCIMLICVLKVRNRHRL